MKIAIFVILFALSGCHGDGWTTLRVPPGHAVMVQVVPQPPQVVVVDPYAEAE